MPLIAYRTHRFSAGIAETIRQANAILDAERADGYTLTLRQLYYQFVAKNLIPNSEAEYKKLGRTVTDAREAGLMDWYAIEDRGRNYFFHSYKDDAEKVLDGLERALGINPWDDQDTYLEVWVEKQALESVVARPASRKRAPYMACKGYLSASEAWRAGGRFEAAIARGKRPVLLHLGDHDPSGMDMTRDNGDRLSLFARQGVEVRRLALNYDQVEQHRPPPNPAKVTDSRWKGYMQRFGKDSWELDALPNRVIDKIITEAIESYIDPAKWEASMERERELRKPLALLKPRWDEVLALVTSPDRPLDRLASMLDVIAGEDLIPRLSKVLHTEAEYGSQNTRRGALIALRALDTTTADTPNQQVCIEAETVFAEVTALADIPPSHEANHLRAHLQTLAEACEPVPYVAPDLKLDNDYEPEDPETEELEDRFGDSY